MNDKNMLAAIAIRRNQLEQDYSPTEERVFYSIFEHLPGYDNFSKMCFRPLISDARNECFLLYTLLMLATVLPSALMLLYSFWWLGAVAHMALFLSYVGSYTAILHNSSHKPIYNPRFRFLNHIIPYLLAPFFGQTWNTSYYHHVKHHHVQNNGPNDISSTMAYQRDSIIDFIRYFSRFFFLASYELPRYFLMRGQFYEACVTFGGELASLLVMYVTYRFNAPAAVTVLVAPWVIVRFGMMSGNWAQHAFIDPKDPTNEYKSSTVCVNHAYNMDAFNDGYHTSHHLNPLRHWSEHPTHMITELSKYHANDTIVLKDVDFMSVWFLLMTKNYPALADSFVQIGPNTLSKRDAITLLKRRVTRFA